ACAIDVAGRIDGAQVYTVVSARSLQPQIQQSHRLGVSKVVRSLQTPIDHVEVGVAVLLRPAPQRVIRIQIEVPKRGARFLETEKVIKVDVVQIEFEIVLVVVDVVV